MGLPGSDLREFGALGAKITAHSAAGAGIQHYNIGRQLVPFFPHFGQFTVPGVNLFQKAGVAVKEKLFCVILPCPHWRNLVGLP
jgi:hypothetical protein